MKNVFNFGDRQFDAFGRGGCVVATCTTLFIVNTNALNQSQRYYRIAVANP